MKLKTKLLLLALMLVGTVGLTTGCSNEENPYEVNDELNYTVSVKYDANGGTFTTNTSVIVDSYNISEMTENSEGNVEIALISPDNSSRGNDAFLAVNNGYFLAGWYAERTEAGVDENGNTVYTYGKKWDFEKDTLAVDADASYSAKEPVITLYAAWVPLFEIEFYSMSGELINTMAINPMETEEIELPVWSEETGAVEMNDFPKNNGYTFNGAYWDADGKQKIEDAAITHTGIVDYETGTAKDSVMKLYVDFIEGEWYHIYTVDQFVDNANVNGCYEIHADLDFTDAIWPSAFMYGNFAGTINGNGHTMKNIEIAQTNNSKMNAGLFGNITESASISGLTFENVTFTIEAGTRVAGTSYGLFAGNIAQGAAISEISIVASTLQIDSNSYFGVDDYSIGLACGMGDATVFTQADITCTAVGENPEKVQITVNGNEVTLEFLE